MPSLKPLPDKLASPTKSCLRSPLKPKTPGRVVEFTSSTLSPLAQMEVRAERTGLVSWGQEFEVEDVHRAQQKEMLLRQQQKQQEPQHVSLPTQEAAGDGLDKENADRHLYESRENSPRPSSSHSNGDRSGSPRAPPLSQTMWTRAHWLRLDGLLQERRHAGPMVFQLRHPKAIGPRSSSASASVSASTSTSTSTSAALKGKMVVAQGVTMALEQWHLDVVDAFRDEVGGWKEAVLAKRLFALLVGEERRRKGLVHPRE